MQWKFKVKRPFNGHTTVIKLAKGMGYGFYKERLLLSVHNSNIQRTNLGQYQGSHRKVEKNLAYSEKSFFNLQAQKNGYLIFFILYFISIFIFLTRRKTTEALIDTVSNYLDLLPEMPR